MKLFISTALFLLLSSFFSLSSFGQAGIIMPVYDMYGVQSLLVDTFGNNYSIFGSCIKKMDPSWVTTIIANNLGVTGYSGDGGPATAATMSNANSMIFDKMGNIIFPDIANHVIRKINFSSGIITTIAGTGTMGCSGDGGQATNAEFNQPYSVAYDLLGNLYIADNMAQCIRKVDTAGIIRTIAGVTGTGTSAVTGDGGPATLATFISPTGITVDNLGNIYIADYYTARIRKIDTSGIITTFAGNGILGYSGDGGPATAAQIGNLVYINHDGLGNIYLCDNDNFVIRKINNFGIISTIVGNGTSGYTGHGGPATAASIAGTNGITFDRNNFLYLGDIGPWIIRKVYPDPIVVSTHFSVIETKQCNDLILSVFSPSQSNLFVYTDYGDGTSEYSQLLPCRYYTKYVNLRHSYPIQGNYTIRHILFDGSLAIDSLHYTYNATMCNTVPIRFYYDANHNNHKDSSEQYLYQSVTIEIDSNNIAIDTISSTNGIDYYEYGNTGDIYNYKVISSPVGFIHSSPVTGFIKDTINSIDNYSAIEFGFDCASATTFDLQQYNSQRTRVRRIDGQIIVENAYCSLENGILSVDFSNKYVFGSAYPTPTSVIGNTISWNLNDLSAINSPPVIHYFLDFSSTPVAAGDTIHTSIHLSPTFGDIDSSNNSTERIDTATGSYDPNEMEVSPLGLIPAGTELLYSINFENTGTDTAYNIYVIDTLSDYLDATSFRMVSASHNMITSIMYYNSHKILKFQFSNINLPDSTHHNLCHGMCVFKVKTRSDLVAGTRIYNEAGIYFDGNPAVNTNIAHNTIIYPEGLNNINKPKVKIYPNPVTEEMIIDLNNTSFSQASITNMLGTIILRQSLTVKQTKINLDGFPSGFYYISLSGKDGTETQKVFKN